LAGRIFGGAFPFGTLAVNVIGSLLIGALAVLLLSTSRGLSYAPLVITGFLGGFTTFSAFSLDALNLIQSGQSLQALIYVGGSVFLSFGVVAFGAVLARGLIL
jgi:fluoride exporter